MEYSQVPNIHPQLIDFLQPPQTLLGPPLINVMEIDYFYKPLISFPSFVSTIYAQFSWQNSILLYIFFVLCFMTTCFCAFRHFIIM